MIPIRHVVRASSNFRNHGLLFAKEQQRIILLFMSRTKTSSTIINFEQGCTRSLQYTSFKRRRSFTQPKPTQLQQCHAVVQNHTATLCMSTTTTTTTIATTTSEKSRVDNSNDTLKSSNCLPLGRMIDNCTHDDLVIANRNRIDVAIVGLPNAGKSQLLNVMTESKIAAVSRKRHTTRESGILGARTIYPTSKNDDSNTSNNTTTTTTIRCTVPTQVVFVDTPGFLKVDQAKREGLNRDLVLSAKTSMEHVDYTLLVVDAAKKLSDPVKETLIELMFQALASRGRLEFSDSDDDDDDNELDTDSDSDINTDDSGSDSDSKDDNNDADSDDTDDDDDDDVQRIITKQDAKEKFAVVLNKVDLIYPKSDLLDIAMEVGELAENCIKYNYQQSYNLMKRAKSGPSRNNDDDDDDEEPTPLGATESGALKKYVESNMPMFFYVSAKKKNGVDDIVQYLTDMATPCYSWDVEADQVSTLTPLEQIEEVIREKIYRCLHKEVPYQIEQENRLLRVIPTTKISNNSPSGSTNPKFDERNNNATGRPTVVIHQDLIVRSKSHQNLVTGTSKQTLERIRSTAERDLSYEVFKCPVQLSLHVKLSKRSTNEKRLPSTQQNANK